jgi:hypothetical protein
VTVKNPKLTLILFLPKLYNRGIAGKSHKELPKSHLKGQSHEKVGKMRVQGDSLGPKSSYYFLKFSDRPFNSCESSKFYFA